MAIDRTKKYRLTDLEYKGLLSQIPRGAAFGYKDPDNPGYMIFSGENYYRLLDVNYDLDKICQTILGKPLEEVAIDISEFDTLIWDYTTLSKQELNNDFRTIDYTTQLTCKLVPKRTTVQGEVVKVEWFTDDSLSTKILEVNINYERDEFGFATSRTTERIWMQRNGEPHPKTKITQKYYKINLEDTIKEGVRRRQNIVDGVQMPAFAACQEVLAAEGKTPEEILALGRTLIESLNDDFKIFVDTSAADNDPESPTFGVKKIIIKINELAETYTWMKTPTTIFNGASIVDYLSNEFNI